MRLDKSVRGLSALSTQIAEFRIECQEAEHTDTADAWALIGVIEQAINRVVVAWNEDSELVQP